MRSEARQQRPLTTPRVAGRRERRGERSTHTPDPGEQREKGLSRRDLFAAGIGVAAGVVTTGVTTFALERVGPAIASSDLEVFPEIFWAPQGGWTFYAGEPLDLSDQPDSFAGPDGEFTGPAIDWLVTHGCVVASPLVVNLHLSRPGNAAAVVRNVRLVNHRRAAALSGASYSTDSAGGNPNTVLAVDLEGNPPYPVESDFSELFVEGDLSGRPPAFSTMTFSVEPHLTETLTIGFMTQKGLHSFQLAVDYFVEGRDHRVVVPSAADLLRVTQHTAAREDYEIPWIDEVYRFVRT